MALTSRPFRGSSEIALIVDWVRAVRPSDRRFDYPGILDLPALLEHPINQRTLRLWVGDADDLHGFAFVDAFHTLRFDVDWRKPDPRVERAIIDWGLRCPTAAPTLVTTTHEGDAERLLSIRRMGFVRCDDAVIHLERDLQAPIVVLSPPPPFMIRAVSGEQEAAAIAALHRAAFGTPHMTTERRLAIMRDPHYDRRRDVVAVTPDGTLAAYALATVSPEQNRLTGRHACATDQFATHPHYRGRGLARALLSRLLDGASADGYALAMLNTSSENRAMLDAATSAGFRAAARTLRFERHAATDAAGMIEPHVTH